MTYGMFLIFFILNYYQNFRITTFAVLLMDGFHR
jgi:hypothetical protein